MSIVESSGVLRMITAGAAVAAAVMFAAPAGAATSSSAGVAPPSDKITVSVIAVNGSGCPAGSATVKVNPDNTGFHISYSDFLAKDGTGVTPTAFRKNCQVALRFDVPQGFTYAIASADYRGRAQLAHGATALQRTNYYFQGDADNNFVDHTFAGPLNGGWKTSDSTDVEALVYSPCGATVNLNVNTELRVNSASSYSWISMRASDGDVDTLLQFSWKRC